MFTLTRTNSKSTDFIQLVQELDADLAIKNGDDNAFFAQFNTVAPLQYVVVLYVENNAVGCGAIKAFNEHTMEIKRMYVKPEYRGKGRATEILNELQNWTKELGYSTCVLETGQQMTDALRLYTKNGFSVIPNYEPYTNVATSVCLKKEL